MITNRALRTSLAVYLSLCVLTTAYGAGTGDILYRHGSDIWVMNPTGGEKRFVFRGRDSMWALDTNGQTRLLLRTDGRYATRSSDGTAVAFVSIVDPYRFPNDEEILVLVQLNTVAKNITNSPGKDIQPAWSPDGRQIAFASNRIREVEPQDIFIMDADGTNVRHLVYGWQPSWSRDGRRIAFASNVDSRDGWSDIYLVDTDGRNRKRLTNDRATDRTPAWSPDGTKIVFVHDTGIAVMNSDGTNLHTIIDDKVSVYPTWSPDGSRIAFERLVNGNFEIFVMNGDGTDQRNITNDPADDRWPSWCPVPLATAVSPNGKTPLVWAQLKRAIP